MRGAPRPRFGPPGAAGRVCARGRRPLASHSARPSGGRRPASAPSRRAGSEASRYHPGYA
eukprot:14003312-Alexandrium_andersonii.AAC.1